MNSLVKAVDKSLGTPPLDWRVEQLRDTDGDGRIDIIWRQASSGETRIWRMKGFTKVSAAPIGTITPDWQLR